MNKPDKNFRLSKTAKRMAATYTNPHDRGAFIRLMVDAEIEAMKQPPAKEKGSRGNNPTD